jgi:multidrug efflux pump subunit AcrA (membrane-fusion protein)
LRGRKGLIAAAIGVVILGGSAGAWAMTRPGKSTAASTTSLVTVSSTTLRQTVSSTGTIAPATESDLSFAVSGTVNGVKVAVGTKVAKGTVLATVGTTDLQAAVSSAQANLDAANAAVTAASGSSATQLAAAQAQATAAQSKLTTAQQSLAAARLTSPIAGTVAAVNIAAGDQVSGSGSSGGSSSGAGSASGSGTGSSAGSNSGTDSGSGSSGSGASSSGSSSAQIIVISTGSWVVNASVGSADLASIKKGLQAEITPTDATTRVFGIVSSVGIIASSSSGTATFPVLIAVTGSPTGLYAGGSATVAIIVKQLPNVLTVPTAAVHTANGKTVVYQRKNGSQVNTPVTVGAVFGPSTQIIAGLKSGDQVVVTSVTGGRGTRSGTGTQNRTGGTGGGGGGFGGGGFGGGGFGGGGTGTGKVGSGATGGN